MKRLLSLAIACCLVLAAGSMARAQATNFGPPRGGVPWAGNSRGQAQTRRSLVDAMQSSAPERPVGGWKPSHWSNMDMHPNDKGLLVRTREFFMPWTKSDPQPPLTGSQRIYQGKLPPEMRTKPSQAWWTYLLPYDPEEPKQANDVNDFLIQPRVDAYDR